VVTPTLGYRLRGDVTADGKGFLEDYERVEADPLAGIGQFSGLEQMDVALGGAKRHELWIHAAYTGGLKSSFALNWAYNQAVYFKHDTLFFSLEMPYKQCRNLLYAMHSSHEKFKAIRYQLGLQSDPLSSIGLPYDHIKYGTLHEWHPNARRFLFDYVVPDFNDRDANGYGRIHIEVADPDKTDFTVADLRQTAELIHSEHPFASIFVDHISLMSPRKWVSSTTERINEVVRDLKRLAMSFNRGLGIAVIGLFQIGREGYKRVKKSREGGGRAEYNPTDLSYSNECERSADIITATWVDKSLEEQNRVEFQNLKSRDQKKFETFWARVEWPCRRILVCYDVPTLPDPSGTNQVNDQKNIDEAADKLLEGIDD